jgi:hypothetical protein
MSYSYSDHTERPISFRVYLDYGHYDTIRKVKVRGDSKRLNDVDKCICIQARHMDARHGKWSAIRTNRRIKSTGETWDLGGDQTWARQLNSTRRSTA